MIISGSLIPLVARMKSLEALTAVKMDSVPPLVMAPHTSGSPAFPPAPEVTMSSLILPNFLAAQDAQCRHGGARVQCNLLPASTESMTLLCKFIRFKSAEVVQQMRFLLLDHTWLPIQLPTAFLTTCDLVPQVVPQMEPAA